VNLGVDGAHGFPFSTFMNNEIATVTGPNGKIDGTLLITDSKVVYSDGYTITHEYPIEKAVAVINFLKSCGSTIGPFGPTC
jgi:hypothetical protein